MAMRWSHSGSLEQIGMADKWKLASKRLAVVLVQGRRIVCEGGGHRLRMSRFSSCFSREVGPIEMSLNAFPLTGGERGEPFVGE